MRLAAEYFIRFIIWLLAHVCYRLQIKGRENIPKRGAALLICNHVSFVDWLFIAAGAGRPVRFVMDYLYFRGRMLKSVLGIVRVIPIAGPREDSNILELAYKSIATELANGELVCIFPEGTITRNGSLSKFKPGVMKILKTSPVPVIPMALHGLWGSLFSHGGGAPLRKWPRRFRAKIELSIGEPLPAADVSLAVLDARVIALAKKE